MLAFLPQQQQEPLQGFDSLGQLPPAASTFAPDVDGLFYFCFWISVFFFFFIAGLLVYTTMQNRRKTETQPAASNVTHNTPLEVVWTLVPTIILMVIFAWGWKGNLDQSIAPGDALQYQAIAQKWNWSFQHPGQKGFTPGEFWVPLDRPVKFTTHSTDVLHSFYVPAFRAKRDVLPGRYQTVWFQATQEGSYPMLCAEYCGDEHSQMRAVVHVVTQEEFDKAPWNARPEDPIEWGEQLYNQYCTSCHRADNTGEIKAAPNLWAIWGKEEELEDGSRVPVDKDYIVESIRYPQAKIVKGFTPGANKYNAGAMTAFSSALIPDEGIDAIVQWLQTLKD